ncbi:MAG: HEAT repeat domain-containing protein [Planctomycetota bacterium]|nr:HEAT repeat domain-containing protein [Planctomycetota bacterium]
MRQILLRLLLLLLLPAGCGGGDEEKVHQGKTVREWTAQLDSQNFDTRHKAAVALAEIGPPARSAVPRLIVMLKDYESERKWKEAQPLYEVVGVGIISSDPPSLTKAAADALAKIGKDAVPALIPELKNSNLAVRLSVVSILSDIGPAAAESIAGVADILQAGPDQRERLAAAGALARIGAGSTDTVAPLVKSMKTDPDALVRKTAADSLGELGKCAASAVPDLIEVVEKKPDFESDAAAAALGRIGPDARAAIPALIDGMTKDNLCRVCAGALVMIGSDSTPALARLFQDANRKRSTRQIAVNTLGKLGAAASEAVPALVAALEDGIVEHNAEEALKLIGPCAVPALAEALKTMGGRARPKVPEILGAIGAEAKGAAPDLIEFVRNHPDEYWDNMTAERALQALAAIAPDDESVVEVFMSLLDDKDRMVRIHSVKGLAAGRSRPEDRIRALAQLLGDKDAGFRAEVEESIVAFGEPAIPALLEALRSDNAKVRESAASAFRKMGPVAASAVEALTEARDNDPDDGVRREAKRALERILERGR